MTDPTLADFDDGPPRDQIVTICGGYNIEINVHWTDDNPEWEIGDITFGAITGNQPIRLDTAETASLRAALIDLIEPHIETNIEQYPEDQPDSIEALRGL